ncbi:MAG TPA: hypothetical protein PLX66_00305 [Bacilli bacterium]|nr:hypothetical protein [Bacilli bacterium]
MDSRMEKYYQSSSELPKRTEKNADIYKEINKNEIDKFKMNSNISVLEKNSENINIEELKTILDKKYTNSPKRKSIFISTSSEEDSGEPEETTKEYDINAILEKAREEKEEDYEADRFKKINDTQLDILKSLNVNSAKEECPKSPESDELMTLINTISAKELANETKLNPLDILSDLKGSDNTEVIEPIKETMRVDTSFYTSSVGLTKKDMEENEAEDEVDKKRPFVWIITVIAILAFLVGVVIIVNKYFNLGLF